MKKMLVLVIIIFISGCSNQENSYESFEHYTLKDKDINSYSFYNYKQKSTYTIADITAEKKDEGGINGLFYQIEENDYILLDEIEMCGGQNDNLHLQQKYNYFYQDNNVNKLYVVRCLGNSLIEYTLDNENVTKKVLLFDTASISHNSLEYVIINYIENVEQDNIYYIARIANTTEDNVKIKCSLIDYKCEFA